MDAISLNFDKRPSGPGNPCFVIAEAGVNHNGNLSAALQMIDAAADAGADAVKFQTFKALRLVTAEAPKCDYQKEATGGEESQLQMLQRLELSEAAHHQLLARCQSRGICFMSTPFDQQCGDFLESLGMDIFKIPSGEITNLPYLTHIAEKQKPLIVSTGMCNLGEVEEAVQTIEATGNRNFVLLHCVSNYPADPADANLNAMLTLKNAFGAAVGYSDHTPGVEVSLAAVAMGACVIEKHFTLDRNLPGPDHRASLEVDELTTLIRGIRIVESALGHGRKTPVASEASTAEAARKSLIAAKDIPAGAVITEDLIAIKRPGVGLPPAMKEHITNRTARVAIAAGSLLKLDMVA